MLQYEGPGVVWLWLRAGAVSEIRRMTGCELPMWDFSNSSIILQDFLLEGDRQAWPETAAESGRTFSSLSY